MDTIRTRQRNWIGHILRDNSLQRKIAKGRRRGRPRQKLMDWMMDAGNLRKRHNIEKSGVVGHLYLPGVR